MLPNRWPTHVPSKTSCVSKRRCKHYSSVVTVKEDPVFTEIHFCNRQKCRELFVLNLKILKMSSKYILGVTKPKKRVTYSSWARIYLRYSQTWVIRIWVVWNPGLYELFARSRRNPLIPYIKNMSCTNLSYTKPGLYDRFSRSQPKNLPGLYEF